MFIFAYVSFIEFDLSLKNNCVYFDSSHCLSAVATVVHLILAHVPFILLILGRISLYRKIDFCTVHVTNAFINSSI